MELGRRESITFHEGHRENGWRITLVDTGARRRPALDQRASRYLTSDRFMLTYGDGVATSISAGCSRSTSRSGRSRPSPACARVALRRAARERQRASAVQRSPRRTKALINGGYFVLERGALDYLTDDPGCTLEREPLEKLAAAGQLSVYRHAGFWQCMDTYRDYQLLNQLWESGGAEWKQW